MLDIDLLNHPCWVTGHDYEIRNIFCDDTASTDGNSTTDSYTWTDHNVSAEPAVFANSDRSTKLWTAGAIAKERIKWVGCGIECTVWSDESAGSNGDLACIEEHSVEINVDVFAKAGQF